MREQGQEGSSFTMRRTCKSAPALSTTTATASSSPSSPQVSSTTLSSPILCLSALSSRWIRKSWRSGSGMQLVPLVFMVLMTLCHLTSVTEALSDDFVRGGARYKRQEFVGDNRAAAAVPQQRANVNFGDNQGAQNNVQQQAAGGVNPGIDSNKYSNNNNNAAGAAPNSYVRQPEVQKLLDQQKERAAQETQRKNDIQQQIEDHEKKMAVQQQEMLERERQRQEREKLLQERRKEKEILQMQREKLEQERIRDHQREMERENKWLNEMQQKAKENQNRDQNQQGTQNQGAQKQDSVNNQSVPVQANDKPEPLVDGGVARVELKPQADLPVVNENGAPPKLVNTKDRDSGIVSNLTNTGDNANKQGIGGGSGNLAVENAAVAQNKQEAEVLNPPENVQKAVDKIDERKDEFKPAAQEEKPRSSNNEVSNDEFNKKDNGVPPVINNEGTNMQKPVETERVNNDNNFNRVLGIPVTGNNNENNIQNNNNQFNGGNFNANQNNVFNNNNNNQVVNNDFAHGGGQPQQPQQPQVGGINLSWDWEDFSIMFNSYGAAEMKVRRSPHPTTGEPWPYPQYYSKKENKVFKVSRDFHFVPVGVTCDVLDEALTRHLQRTLRGSVEDMYDNLQNAEGTPIEDPTLRYEKDEFLKAPLITRVEVKVKKPCDKYPSLESDESYDLVVKKRKTYIWANEVWGALRGLETFGQLVWVGTDGFLYIKETVISDYPRFPHRGLHIDTSRHYLFKEVLLDIMDSMEMNKLNVFHWHIVDDQSFPYESKVYPELSRKGAFHPTYVYSLEDIAELIEYARMRGIRVMPEFDTPGHTYSWGLSRPDILTQCYSGSTPVKGYLGPIDPVRNSTYRFLQTLFQEVVETFKDQYLHLGGDEVPLGCWQSNPDVMAFAQELARKPVVTQQQNNQYMGNNFGWSMWSEDIRRVYEHYENRLIGMLNEIGQKRKKGVKYVMWQEVMNNNLQLPNDTIIQVWMGDMADVMRATSMGYQVLYSTCWYLDHIEYGTKWPKYYNCDPVDQSYGYHIDEKKVLGGEAAFWSEYFSNENLIPLMWPRASAAAERLWSSKDIKNLDKAAARLSEHRCRMIKRGINAGEISGPGYCLHSPPKRRLFNDTLGCKGGNCSRTHNIVQIEDIELHLSQRGGSIAECGNVFTQGNSNIFILLTLALLVVLALFALSKSSSKFHRMRICKNRSILLVFVVVLLVYFLCYTTIWMRAFEFSGSFHKTLQEDNRSGDIGEQDDNSNLRPIHS